MNDSSRPIPPPNMLAATPADAYSIDDIIAPAAATSLKYYVKQLIDAETDEERIGMLVHRHSNWVNKRLNELCNKDKPNKEKMCVPRYCCRARPALTLDSTAPRSCLAPAAASSTSPSCAACSSRSRTRSATSAA